MNAAFGGSETARQPFRPIWPADRPTDGGPALAAALNKPQSPKIFCHLHRRWLTDMRQIHPIAHVQVQTA